VGFTVSRSALGARVRSTLGVFTRQLEDPPVAGVQLRDFVELIITNTAGALSGVLRLHGDATGPAGQFEQVRGVTLWPAAERASEGSASISTLDANTAAPRTFAPALTSFTCNGTVGIDTPLGVTDVTFVNGGAPPGSGIPDISRVRVRRRQLFDGEHWGNLVACATIGATTYFNAATKLVSGHTRLDRIATTGVQQLPLCDGSLPWMGGGPSGGHTQDSWVEWRTQSAGAFDGVILAGPWSQWAIPSNAQDFTGSLIPTTALCFQPAPAIGVRLLGADLSAGDETIVWAAPGATVPAWPNPGWEWICASPTLGAGWPDFE